VDATIQFVSYLKKKEEKSVDYVSVVISLWGWGILQALWAATPNGIKRKDA
jgi:uncharacterized membrane protein